MLTEHISDNPPVDQLGLGSELRAAVVQGLGWVMPAIEEPVTVLGCGTVACGCGYDAGFLDVESVS